MNQDERAEALRLAREPYGYVGKAALMRDAFLDAVAELAQLQERLTAYETPGWINSVQKVLEERRRAERAEAEVAELRKRMERGCCPVCLYDDWEIEYDFSGGDEVEVTRCQNCGWPPSSPHTVEEWRRRHFISPYLRDLEGMVAAREARVKRLEAELEELRRG